MDRKPVFDLIRNLLGRPLTGKDVRDIDDALDDMLGVARVVPDAPSAPESAHIPETVGTQGIAIIKRFEGCHKKRPDGAIEAYPDPGSGGEPWTIGWGTTRMRGRAVRRGDTITQGEADELLAEQLVQYADDVKRALGSALARTSQPQFDALVSFHYNTGAIARATLTAAHRAGDFAKAEREFGRWNRAAGRVMAGLTRRRTEEAALYRSGS